MDRGHVELVKQHGDGLAEAVGGLVHTARYGYCHCYCCAASFSEMLLEYKTCYKILFSESCKIVHCVVFVQQHA